MSLAGLGGLHGFVWTVERNAVIRIMSGRKVDICIAGSRDFDGPHCEAFLFRVMELFIEAHPGIWVDRIICGMAPGADLLGKKWAEAMSLDVLKMPADWDNLEAPNARIKKNRYGKLYNANAGHDRNKDMAHAADCVIVFWDGISPGTAQMIDYCHEIKKPIQIVRFARKMKRAA